MGTHRNSHRHLNGINARAAAVKAADSTSSGDILMEDPTPAILNLADRFSGYHSDDSDGVPQASENPFEGTMTYDDEIFDEDGNEILFSAGAAPMDSSSTDVWKDIEDLEYYDHTVFADMSPMMEQLFDKTNDCTLTDAAAAMAAMGG